MDQTRRVAYDKKIDSHSTSFAGSKAQYLFEYMRYVLLRNDGGHMTYVEKDCKQLLAVQVGRFYQ